MSEIEDLELKTSVGWHELLVRWTGGSIIFSTDGGSIWSSASYKDQKSIDNIIDFLNKHKGKLSQ